jgi:serine/threonine protein kinase
LPCPTQSYGYLRQSKARTHLRDSWLSTAVRPYFATLCPAKLFHGLGSKVPVKWPTFAGYKILNRVGGGSLTERLAGRPQAERQSAHWVRMLALAVQHAYDHQVLHRDLKSANILIADLSEATTPADPSAIFNRESAIPKIADFGVIRLLDRADRLTQPRQWLGTSEYMAPE